MATQYASANWYAEPVESVTIRFKRSMLTELHETIGRLLARSTGLKKK